jgi:hypothetical protein
LLEDIGNLGDFISGIAVVVTIIYLTIQIRQNTASVRAATIQSAAQANAEMLDHFVRDPELYRIYQAGTCDFEGLSPEGRFRFASIMGSMLHRVEGMVYQSANGLLPPESWAGGANRIRGAFLLPGTCAWWERGKHAFNPGLQRWVEQEVMPDPVSPPDA